MQEFQLIPREIYLLNMLKRFIRKKKRKLNFVFFLVDRKYMKTNMIIPVDLNVYMAQNYRFLSILYNELKNST